MKALVTLAIAGALLIPAAAQAKTLPPGYTAQDEFVDTPMFGQAKDCAHGRAKLLRWHIQDYKGVVDRQSLKLAVCARDGHVYWSNRVNNRWDGNRGPWDYFGQPTSYGGVCCGDDGRYAHTDQNYVWHGPGGVDNYWVLALHIKAHVGGPGRGNNDVWFSKWSRFS